MAGTHKCYFVILWMQVQWSRYHDAVGETETIPYRKEFVWTFCSHRWRTHENFRHDHLPLALRMSWRNREIQSYPFILLTILPPANKVWDKVMFFKVGVCPQGGGGVCIISLPVWLTGLMFLLGVSVSDPMFFLGGSAWGRPPSPVRWRVGRGYVSYWQASLYLMRTAVDHSPDNKRHFPSRVPSTSLWSVKISSYCINISGDETKKKWSICIHWFCIGSGDQQYQPECLNNRVMRLPQSFIFTVPEEKECVFFPGLFYGINYIIVLLLSCPFISRITLHMWQNKKTNQ